MDRLNGEQWAAVLGTESCVNLEEATAERPLTEAEIWEETGAAKEHDTVSGYRHYLSDGSVDRTEYDYDGNEYHIG
jgi:hypothetical protein